MHTYRLFVSKILVATFGFLAISVGQTLLPPSAELPVGNVVKQFPGEIFGTVLDASGKPLAAAKVSAVIVSHVEVRRDATVTPHALEVQTTKAGSYHIDNLPLGDYRVCIEMQNQSLLSTCVWGTAVHISLKQGSSSASAPTVQLAAAAKLHIRVNDAMGLAQVATAKGGVGKAGMSFGLPSPTGMIPLASVGSDASGQDFEVLVPFDKDLTVMPMGKLLRLTDSKGAAIDASKQTIPIRFASGAAQNQIVLNLASIAN